MTDKSQKTPREIAEEIAEGVFVTASRSKAAKLIEAALAAERQKRDSEHCRDCCCARAWKALGVTEFTGKSIPEHIASLTEENERLRAEIKDRQDTEQSLTNWVYENGERIKTLEDALKYYADERYYRGPNQHPKGDERLRSACYVLDVGTDGGQIAREALDRARGEGKS